MIDVNRQHAFAGGGIVLIIDWGHCIRVAVVVVVVLINSEDALSDCKSLLRDDNVMHSHVSASNRGWSFDTDRGSGNRVKNNSCRIGRLKWATEVM
jgi:hypothetical protein